MASKKNTVEMTLEAKDKASPVIGKLGKNLKNFRKETDSTSGSIRGMRGGLQNLGHQFQDIAVQVQSNTNPFTIFAQQGSQIASSFGPGGAMLGALIAVTGALGTGLAPALFAASDATDHYSDVLENLKGVVDETTGGVDILSERILKMAERSRIAAKAEIASSMHKLREELDLADEAADSFGRTLLSGWKIAVDYDEAILTMGRSVESSLVRSFDLAEPAAKKLDSIFKTFGSSGLKSTRDVIALSEAVDDWYLTLEDPDNRITEYRDNLSALADNTASAAGKLDFLKEVLLDVDSAFSGASISLDKYNDPFVGMLDSKEALELFYSDQEVNISTMISDLSTLGSSYRQFFGNLAQASKEGSAAQKVFFAISQSISATQSIMSGFSAAMKVREAYAGIIGGQAISEPMAHSYIGLGFANAGIIAGQTIASFDGGGFTGSGSRTGGLDGKGGFNAVLHPNETVIDHTKGQGMAPKIEVYNYSGQQAQVLTEGDVTRIVVGQMSNANSEGRRGLVQTSNLQNRGVR